jgi:hypothetical protein
MFKFEKKEKIMFTKKTKVMFLLATLSAGIIPASSYASTQGDPNPNCAANVVQSKSYCSTDFYTCQSPNGQACEKGSNIWGTVNGFPFYGRQDVVYSVSGNRMYVCQRYANPETSGTCQQNKKVLCMTKVISLVGNLGGITDPACGSGYETGRTELYGCGC